MYEYGNWEQGRAAWFLCPCLLYVQLQIYPLSFYSIFIYLFHLVLLHPSYRPRFTYPFCISVYCRYWTQSQPRNRLLLLTSKYRQKAEDQKTATEKFYCTWSKQAVLLYNRSRIHERTISLRSLGTTYVYIKSTTVCKSPRRNWDSPNPSLASECAPPPDPGWGGTLACEGGVGGVPFPTTGEKA